MRGRHLLLIAAALLAGVIAFDSCADQVYRWVDKDGHVHYSSTPPPTTATPAQKLNINTAVPAPASGAAPAAQPPAGQSAGPDRGAQCLELQQQLSQAGQDASLSEAVRLRKQRMLTQQIRTLCPPSQ